VIYGGVLIMAATAYYILVMALLAEHGAESVLAKAVASGFKERVSIFLYLLGIGLAFLSPWLGISVYAIVAVIWLVPDRRIEKSLVSR
jgi:uncharacterized membrane protein